MKDIVIDLKIFDKKHLTSCYNENVINSELSNYINNYMIGTNIKANVIINIKSEIKFTKEEKDKYINIIRQEFLENINELNEEMKNTNIKRAISFLLGTMFITLAYFANNFLGEIISQVFVIFGWVAIWECDYSIIFAGPKRKRVLKRYHQLYKSTIKFLT